MPQAIDAWDHITSYMTRAYGKVLGDAVIPSSDDDMAQIAALERNQRLTSPDGLAPAWD